MAHGLKILLTILIVLTHLAPLAQAADMGEILPAQTRCRSITNGFHTDCFIFNADAGQTVLINMTRESGSINPEISLYAPDRNLEVNAWGGIRAEIEEYQIRQSGTYTIVVGDYTHSKTGDYSLTFTKITQP